MCTRQSGAGLAEGRVHGTRACYPSQRRLHAPQCRDSAGPLSWCTLGLHFQAESQPAIPAFADTGHSQTPADPNAHQADGAGAIVEAGCSI